MRSRSVVSRLALAMVMIASTLAIACATSNVNIPNESVELAQIRRVEADFTKVLDAAIRTQIAGGRSGIELADKATDNETGEKDESGRPVIIRQKFYRLHGLGRELTVFELQRIREALQLRVDEAYAAGSLANFPDLASLRVSNGVIEGSINRGAGR